MVKELSRSRLGLAREFGDLRAALSFLTRIPCGGWADARPSGSAFLRYAPLAGVVVASIAAAVLGLGAAARLPSTVSSVLALGVSIFATGALHEDGLADVADGFGGGSDRDRKLAIMRDSRIGSYGACALGCSLILRTVCLAGFLDRGVGVAASALVVAAAISRAAMLVPMAVLPPARPDGLARTTGTLPAGSLTTAVLLALTATFVVGLLGHCPPGRLLAAAVAAFGTGALWVGIARRQIGGVTGDVIGATQQSVEMAVLVVLSAGA